MPLDAIKLDVEDSLALQAFCSGCRVIVNCAGPSCHIRDRVARAAFRAGADYVDPGGDEPLAALHHTLVGHLSQGELKELIRLLEKVREPLAGTDD